MCLLEAADRVVQLEPPKEVVQEEVVQVLIELEPPQSIILDQEIQQQQQLVLVQVLQHQDLLEVLTEQQELHLTLEHQ
jgi:hypothetical protein